MLALSIIYSSIAMVFLFLLLRRWLDIKISILLTLLILTNPMVWFYSCITEIYPFDLFFSITLAWLGLGRRGIYFTPVFVGLLSGIRQSSGILIIGLYIFLWYRHIKTYSFSWKKFGLSHLLGLGAFLIWFIPMVKTCGGIEKYISLYSTNNPIPKASFLQNLYAFSSYLVFISPIYFVSIIYMLSQKLLIKKGGYSKSNSNKLVIDKNFILLLLYWCIPPLLFFLFYYYTKGYFLLCITPFIILPVTFIYKKFKVERIVIFTIIIQILIFCTIPYSRPDVRSYFSPSIRQISILRVWFERTGSVYLMSQAHIGAMTNTKIEIENLLENISSISMDTLENKLIIIDPTIPVHIRALQVRYPNKEFCALSYYRLNEYTIYHQLKIKNKSGLDDLFKRALIISRTTFVKKYLKNMNINIYTSGEYSIFKAEQVENINLAKLYTKLFYRIQ